jgi:hypothetical protein
VWLVPGIALAAAIAVARRPALVVLVAIAVIAMIVHEQPSWTEVQAPTSRMAAIVDDARQEHLRVCGIVHTGVGVIAYTHQPPRAFTPSAVARCDVQVGFYVTPALDVLERRFFPYAWRLPGEVTGYVYSRRPQSVLEAGRPSTVSLRAHSRTWPN